MERLRVEHEFMRRNPSYRNKNAGLAGEKPALSKRYTGAMVALR